MSYSQSLVVDLQCGFQKYCHLFYLRNSLYLSFVPIVIMSALWFSQLFTQYLGRLPSINWENLLASLPTLISAIISKNLLVTVIVGIISLALIRMVI